MEFELSIIENLFKGYDGSACCVTDEATGRIILFNELCKELCPSVEKDMLIEELYNKISVDYDIVTEGDSTFLVADKDKLFGEHYYLSEHNVTLSDGSKLCICFFRKIGIMQFYHNFINTVNSRLFLRDCDFSVIIDLNNGSYYITCENGEHKSYGSDIEAHDWNMRVDYFVEKHLAEECVEDYKKNMSTESLRKLYEKDTDVNAFVFDYYFDGEKITQKVVCYFIEYNGNPVVCVKYYDDYKA